MQAPARAGAALLAAIALTAIAACTGDTRTGPHPDLSPAQVVTAQLAALSRVARDGGDAELEAALRFASPGNRRAVGSPQRFAAMLENPLYAALLHHRDAAVGSERKRDGGDVQVSVEVRGADGRRSRYLYTLRRHDIAGCPGCWLIEGVVPQPADEAPGEPDRSNRSPQLST